MTDITEQKLADEIFRESEGRFRAIYENAPVLINGFNEHRECWPWNTECYETFGWTIEEVNASENPLKMFYPDPPNELK
jgi:PAS domain S-box-containing protein